MGKRSKRVVLDTNIFISACATSAGVDLIISGDPDLLNIKEYKGIKIIKASKFIRQIQGILTK